MSNPYPKGSFAYEARELGNALRELRDAIFAEFERLILKVKCWLLNREMDAILKEKNDGLL